MSLNHIVLHGRMVHNPEKRVTGSGVAVTSFTLAVDRDFKADNGERETDFIDCVAWRNTAEFVGKYFTKGQMAVVSGRLQIRQYQAKDGSKRRAAEVVAENVYFGESKRQEALQTATQFAPPSYALPAQTPYAAGQSTPLGPEFFYNANGAAAPTNQFPHQAPGQFELVEKDDSELPF